MMWYMIKQVAIAVTDTVKKYIVLPLISGTKNLVRTLTEEVNTPDAPIKQNKKDVKLLLELLLIKFTFAHHYSLSVSSR